jgi:hypothetical protein
VVESNNYIFILLIYFVAFVPIEDVKIAAVDVKIHTNYIKMHQNWDRKHSVGLLDPIDILDVEERQNYIQMHQKHDPKHTSTLHIDLFNILDVEKDRKIHSGCRKR